MMGKSVSVPLPLLDSILRLVDGFDGIEDLNFNECGYNPCIEYDNAVWELRLKIRQLQCHLADIYLLTIGEITDDERRALHGWVEAGNSVYCNPDLLYDCSGSPMDFISGHRMAAEIYEEYSSSSGGAPDIVDEVVLDDGIPF
jgi:hypothetical protein